MQTKGTHLLFAPFFSSPASRSRVAACQSRSFRRRGTESERPAKHRTTEEWSWLILRRIGPPQPSQKFCQVSWQGCVEVESFAGDGMIETQLRRVQGQSRSAAAIGKRLAIQRAAVDGVAAERMPSLGQVDAD